MEGPIGEKTEEKREEIRAALIAALISLLLITAGIIFFSLKKISSSQKNLPQKNSPVVSQSSPTPSFFKPQPTAVGLTPTPTKIFPTPFVEKEINGWWAFIRDSNVWIFKDGKEIQLTKDGVSADYSFSNGLPEIWYSNPQISPDGKKIAFLKKMAALKTFLMVYSLEEKETKQLVDEIAANLPVFVWARDSNQIFYVTAGGLEKMKLKSIEIKTGKKEEWGEFPFLGGCGGGSPDPADHLLDGEKIETIGGGVLVFEIDSQDSFIVHAVSCTGEGIAKFDLLTKEDKIIDTKATKAKISPDGGRIAAIWQNEIIIFDKGGAFLKGYPTQEAPIVLLWDPSGETIYFSTKKLEKELKTEGELALKILGMSPVTYTVYQVKLWQLNLEDGKEAKIADFNFHGLKPLFVQDEKMLAVGVENATALFDYVNQYKTKENMIKYYPKVKLLEIDLKEGKFQERGERVYQTDFFPIQ